eukprot:941982-Amorphochlora_amoeboformis.AAC.1
MSTIVALTDPYPNPIPESHRKLNLTHPNANLMKSNDDTNRTHNPNFGSLLIILTLNPDRRLNPEPEFEPLKAHNLNYTKPS